jgi:hypothetical protein
MQRLQYYQGRTAALHHFRGLVGHDGLNSRLEFELTEQRQRYRLNYLS